MNKILTICLIMVSSYACYAQKTDTLKNSIQKEAEAIGQGGNNEIKINLLFTVLGVPEVTYERLLADNMGVGASVLVALDRTFDYKFGPIPPISRPTTQIGLTRYACTLLPMSRTVRPPRKRLPWT